MVVPLVVVLLTVLHGPSQAQALFFDFLPFSPETSEPITLLLTGVTLLTLARIGLASARGAQSTATRRPPAGRRRGRPWPTDSAASSDDRAA